GTRGRHFAEVLEACRVSRVACRVSRVAYRLHLRRPKRHKDWPYPLLWLNPGGLRLGNSRPIRGRSSVARWRQRGAGPRDCNLAAIPTGANRERLRMITRLDYR